MSPQAARKPSLYEQLMALPEALTGEIMNGQLRTQPRPGWPHILAGARLGADIEGPYGRGRGGPGGWWVVSRPEVHFILDTEVTVPDLAGWRKQRMPSPPEGHQIQVVPDWVCEIISPSTKSTDREEKMPLYALWRPIRLAGRPEGPNARGLRVRGCQVEAAGLLPR
ncbi:MAG: Uma2 family endonuclease [Gammaproteobacteria bacterium]